ncbi:MAG: outer membrane protein [Nitrospiraceae bacterium]
MATVRVLIVLLTLLIPSWGTAEWFADAYLGGSSTVASNNTFHVNGNLVRQLERSDISTPGGGRLGYWLATYPWLGLALDVSAWNPEFGDTGPPQLAAPVTLTLLPISPLVMVRLPLGQSEQFPKGRVQPYVAGGPTFVFTALSEFAGQTVQSPAVLEDTSMTLGFDLRGGIAAFVTKNVGLFVEYRYLQVRPTLESTTGSGVVRYQPTFQTNAGVVGITYRFGWQ